MPGVPAGQLVTPEDLDLAERAQGGTVVGGNTSERVTVTCRFGPNLDPATLADDNPNRATGKQFHPTDITYESSKYSEAGKLDLKGVTDVLPAIDIPIALAVNGRLIGTGQVDSSTRDSEGLAEVTAYDHVRTLNRATSTRGFGDATPTQILTSLLRDGANLPNDAYTIELVQAATGSGATGGGSAAGQFGATFSPSFDGTPISTALTRMTRLLGGVWFVDASNTVNFLTASDAIQDAFNAYRIRRITEADPGLELPPYRSVRVLGRGTAGGGAPAHFPSANPPKAVAYYDPQGGPEGNGGIKVITQNARVPPALKKPQDTVEDSEITTQKTAETYARELLKAYRERRASGSITLVGDSRLQAQDSVTMPDDPDTHPALNGASYIVTSVTHEASASDGYTTTVSTGGLVTD